MPTIAIEKSIARTAHAELADVAATKLQAIERGNAVRRCDLAAPRPPGQSVPLQRSDLLTDMSVSLATSSIVITRRPPPTPPPHPPLPIPHGHDHHAPRAVWPDACLLGAAQGKAQAPTTDPESDGQTYGDDGQAGGGGRMIPAETACACTARIVDSPLKNKTESWCVHIRTSRFYYFEASVLLYRGARCGAGLVFMQSKPTC
jgi:hypothetical protein